jgi:ligand-binding SRPBCC domain-containing protein
VVFFKICLTEGPMERVSWRQSHPFYRKSGRVQANSLIIYEILLWETTKRALRKEAGGDLFRENRSGAYEFLHVKGCPIHG